MSRRKSSTAARAAPAAPAATAARPVGLLVLGMHRSGTSLIARILSLLGAELPSDLLGANASNPTGHWESTRAIEINDTLLAAFGRRWDDVRELPENWLERPEADAARVQIRAFLEREFGAAPLWVLKEPRMCRLAPLWIQGADELGMDLRVVIPLRHPGQVVYSLARRDGIASGQAQLMWWEHLVDAERDSRGLPRVLVSFEAMIADWRAECMRIAVELGLSWPHAYDDIAAEVEAFITPSLLHSDASRDGDGAAKDIELAPSVIALHDRLQRVESGQAWPIIARAAADTRQHAGLHVAALTELLNEGEVQKQIEVNRSEPARAAGEALGNDLIVELIRQLEAHRSESSSSLEQVIAHESETQSSFQTSAKMMVELVRQVEAQRAELANAVREGGSERGGVRSSLEAGNKLLVELIRQIEAQRGVIGKLGELPVVREQLALVKQMHEDMRLSQQEALSALSLRLDRQRVVGEASAAEAKSVRIALESQVQESARQAETLQLARAQLQMVIRQRDTERQTVARLAEQSEAVPALRSQLQLLVRLRDAERQAVEAQRQLASKLAEQLEDATRKLREQTEQHEQLSRGIGMRDVEIVGLRSGVEAYRIDRDATRQELDAVHERRRHLENQVSQLLGSSSWRLTRPLRVLRRVLTGRPASDRTGGDSLLRAAYVRLPVSWPMRKRIKGACFRLLSPLIRNTHAYRRWQMQLPQPAPVYRDERVAMLAATADPVPTATAPSPVEHRYVSLSADPVLAEELRAKLIAFYLPQFHPIPENDEWWGRGFTEWTNVSKAVPQFEGHEQPHLPGELGFYDLRLPDVMRRQIELARHYGVHGFCFHYYWFDGRRILERPLNQFLDDPSFDMPFCVCWANENWTRRWDGHDDDVLLGQKHTPESDLRFIRDVEPMLRDPRYIRVGGRPLLIVYRPSLLPDCAATLQRWRDHCRESGLGEILLVMVQFDVEDPRPFGFDAAVEFPPHKLARNLPCINSSLPRLNPAFRGYVIDYQQVVDRAIHWPVPEFDLIRGVFPGWDNEARKPGQGYLFAYNSPERYRQWLEASVDFACEHPVRGDSLVFVNAWNEWAEGAYLEPDRRHGYAFLQATREAISRRGGSPQPKADLEPKPRVVVVAHDAHPHGAQYLSHALAREFSEGLGYEVDMVVLGDGVLLDQFREVAAVHLLPCGGGSGEGRALATQLRAQGATIAIANTTVSGKFASDLKQAGFKVISLVHELPGVIEAHGLEQHTACIARDADVVVFAADAVRAGFESFAKLEPDRVLIRPQGLYKHNRYQSPEGIAEARKLLRSKLGLPADSKVVICVGYADLRKGVDLFIDIGAQLVRDDARVHMLWLGHPDLSLEAQLRKQLQATGKAAHFHFPGRDPDTDVYYAGSDLYALTSREDPFPSVVMEAFDVRVPVVAFQSAGGFEELLRRGGGRLVPAFDLKNFAAESARLLADEGERRALGDEGKALVEAEFRFGDYVGDLLARVQAPPPRVSVVVPNYNYARYLPERLASIFAQTLAPFEVIVLDDASTDDSIAVIEELSRTMPLRLIRNTVNSGSVFRQWQRGVEAARGDYVWIAEADDLSEPEFLEKVVDAFERPDVVMAYCQSMQVDGSGELLSGDYLDYVSEFGAERWRSAFVADLGTELQRGLAVKNTIPNVSAVLFRRVELAAVLSQFSEQIGAFRIAGDWVAYLRMLERGALSFEPRALNRHRRHAAGITIGASQRPHLQEVVDVQRWIQERFEVDAPTRQAAAQYLRFLERYFGLQDAVEATTGTGP